MDLAEAGNQLDVLRLLITSSCARADTSKHAMFEHPSSAITSTIILHDSPHRGLAQPPYKQTIEMEQ